MVANSELECSNAKTTYIEPPKGCFRLLTQTYYEH
jgi:hypothetical protein